MVDVELLRSEEWIAHQGLRVGEGFELHVEEIRIAARAVVRSISDGPWVRPGEGSVVTGRFVTRESGDLVRVTLADGSAVVGTAIHPVWSPADGDWRALGDFSTGMVVQTRGGSVEVVSVEAVAGRPPVYNIEIDGEHVYEVGDSGVLVHNGDAFNCQRYYELILRRLDKTKPLTKAESEEYIKLLRELHGKDYGAILTSLAKHGPPEAMENAHAHHILFKAGNGPAQKKLVAEGLEILLRHKIDPITGKANLIWAPNKKGQHTKEALQNVVDTLKAADRNGKGTQAEIIEALERLGTIAAER